MAAGMEVALYSGNESLAGGATTVDLKAEGSYARGEIGGSKTLAAAAASVNRLRMTLEAAHARPLAGGAVVTPSVAVGLRRDGGSGATGSGVEVGGELSWRDVSRRLTVEGRGRALVGHGGDTEEWGVGGLLRVDTGKDGHGLWLSFAPGMGVVRNTMDRQWQGGIAGTPEDEGLRETTAHLLCEAGYGLASAGGRGLSTPYAKLVLSDDGVHSYRAGWRLGLGEKVRLDVEGARRQGAGDTAEHALTLRASLRW